MGRVLLASMNEDELDRYFDSAVIEKLTSRTITDEDELRRIIAKVREDGYAINAEELEEGVQSVSVPVRGKDGKVLAAANVSAHASRVSVNDLVKKLLPRLQACVVEIEQDLNLQN
jgi:IclR family pca regulon transcriptional regulator